MHKKMAVSSLVVVNVESQPESKIATENLSRERATPGCRQVPGIVQISLHSQMY